MVSYSICSHLHAVTSCPGSEWGGYIRYQLADSWSLSFLSFATWTPGWNASIESFKKLKKRLCTSGAQRKWSKIGVEQILRCCCSLQLDYQAEQAWSTLPACAKYQDHGTKSHCWLHSADKCKRFKYLGSTIFFSNVFLVKDIDSRISRVRI